MNMVQEIPPQHFSSHERCCVSNQGPLFSTTLCAEFGSKRRTFLTSRGQFKCDGTRAETRFRLSAKRKSPFKSAGASVQSTTGSRGLRISGSNAGYTMFRGGVKSTGYPLHSPVSPSLPLPCVTVCHRISPGVYVKTTQVERGGDCIKIRSTRHTF
jgi:hypothetical protein